MTGSELEQFYTDAMMMRRRISIIIFDVGGSEFRTLFVFPKSVAKFAYYGANDLCVMKLSSFSSHKSIFRVVVMVLLITNFAF